MPAAPVESNPKSALSQPIDSLEGVGPSRAKQFHQLEVRTLGDLLEYFPRAYVNESAETNIEQLVAREDLVQTARGEVVAVDYVTGRGRPRFEATLQDDTGKLAIVWFNAAYLRRRIVPGTTLRVRGKVKFFRNLPQMAQPKWEVVEADETPIESSKFRAVYSATLKLPSDTIERIVEANLPLALEAIGEWFEPQVLERRGLIGRREAYRAIHRPGDLREAMSARRRIVYDELMLMQLGLGMSRRMRDGRITAPMLRIDKTLDERIRKRFPFEMTDAQRKSVFEIVRDLQSGSPMNRLLQGDVGSGKTAVALYAMLAAIANKLQAAILAPTEVLAEQHFLNLSNLLRGSAVNVELYTSRTKRKGKEKFADKLSTGEVHLAVGTQALIQQDIEFANLGLVVVDEQHKLGVKQRAVLKSKGLAPHYLVMTATPIPRTLALSYFADFDVSVIDQLPPGRQPIKTSWLSSKESGKAYDLVKQEAAAGRQTYIVLPQINDDGLTNSKSVLKESERLAKGPLSNLRLAVLHGDMPADEKQATMARFRDRQIDVLVATTVIEVGIDIPNATVMLIDNADRFGLSQLHQLRGRVGRGSVESHCVLISDAQDETAQARLGAMRQTGDGFEIAELDLKLRGPGEFFGTRQHGLPEFKLADLTSELDLLQQAREDATTILQADPSLKASSHSSLRKALIEQFGSSLDLVQVG